MPIPEVEEFAKLLLKHVRDEAISSCDRLLDPAARNAIAERWRVKMESGSCRDFAKEIIPDCVDEAIFYLLHAIDEGTLQISFTANNGATINLTVDGQSEMAGWFSGTNGWKEAYSRERFNDDLADLKDYFGPSDS